jgi:Leucine-rich repeat (LRR) protein
MNDFIGILNSLGFKLETNLDRLKVTLSDVEEKDYNTDIQSADLRYTVEAEKLTGLHISGQKFLEEDWQAIENGIKEAVDLQVLYLSGTPVESLRLENAGSLTFINVSENTELKSVGLSNLRELVELNASFCPNLTSVSLNGKFEKLEKVDVSNGKIEKFILPKIVQELYYLNFSNNQLVSLTFPDEVSGLVNVFGDHNPIESIQWPKKFEVLDVFQVNEGVFSDDSLIGILKQRGEKLRIALNEYIRILQGDQDKTKTIDYKPVKKLRRLKILFSGNTTTGKSTLRRILLANRNLKKETKKAEASTHGVKVFNKEFVIEGNEIFVQGFDFGGQDYYHATHLPFYEHNSLNFIVYGYNPDGKPVGHRTAYEFGQKEVEDLDEILFPIDYWLGSVLQGGKNDRMHAKNPLIEIELLKWGLKANPESEEIISRLAFLENFENFNALRVLAEQESKSPKIELVQNVFNPFYFQELNNYDLRNNVKYNVDDIKSFDFHLEYTDVKKWILGKIVENSTKEQDIFTIDFNVGKFLFESKDVIFDKESLRNLPLINESYEDDVALKEGLRRLQSHHFGLLFEIDDSEFYYIADIGRFSAWIHEVLSKDLLKVGNGYIEKEKLKPFNENNTNFEVIIKYLEKKDVVFKVKDEKETFLDKWVAPAYLPLVQNRAEMLLISNFDNADVKFVLTEFFHSNIVLILISEFQGDLLLDKQSSEYLMWKNKVILSQKNNDENALLLIELIYPPNESGKPELHIRRNYSAYVANDLFYRVFDFLKTKLDGIEKKTEVKTKFGNYIPYDCLHQDNDVGKKEKSHLIYHDETFYSRYDFKHILQNSDHKAPKVFIGYSRHDLEYVEELLLHLNPYQKKGEVVVFYDRDLKMGDKWDAELKNQLTTSNIFVCLISPYMLNTEYVTDLEIPLAKENGLKIVPIVVADCNWQHLEMGNPFKLLGENNADNKAIPLPADKLTRHVKWKEIATNIISMSINKNEGNE